MEQTGKEMQSHVEHGSHSTPVVAEDIHEFNEFEGYIVDQEKIQASDLKVAKDGHTILVPQPSDNARDPLNWSSFRKHFVLLIVAATAYLPESSSVTGAVDVFSQSIEWHLTPNHVNHATSGNIFMLGVGGLFVVTMSSYIGRLPIMFWFLLFTVLTAIWCASATTFESYMAARILNGFVASVGEAGAIMWINDMFFFHERARKINIFVCFAIIGPFIGPMLSAFILTTQSWRVTFWLCVAEAAVLFVIIVLFFDETYYDRRLSAEIQPPKRSRLLRLVGVEQLRSRKLRNSLWDSMQRPFRTISKPTVLISVLYNFCTFSWSVAVSTTISIYLTPLYHFGLKQVGYIFFAPIVGTLLGYGIGAFLHDFIAKRYIKRHQGRFEPEVRLWSIWIATPIMVAGLVLIGFCLENGYHYMVTAVAWAMLNVGIVISSVAINAYVLDSYPEASGEGGAWLAFGRTTSGFITSYFQIPWTTAEGARATFGIQAGIVIIGLFLVIGLQIYGKRLRVWSGKLKFHTI